MGGVTVHNAWSVAKALENLSEATGKSTRAALRQSGTAIRDLARDYAPVEEGNLEQAIQTKEDRQGINTRMRVLIGIELDYPAQRGKTVDAYAMLMHEGLAPYGSGAYQLGEDSQRKRNMGSDVGGKYLERAINDLQPYVERLMKDAIKREMRRYR